MSIDQLAWQDQGSGGQLGPEDEVLQVQLDEDWLNPPDIWGDLNIYAVTSTTATGLSAKRKYDVGDELRNSASADDSDALFASFFPHLNPSVPLLSEREVPSRLDNPFIHNSVNHYTLKNRLNFAVGAVNGYIKVRFNSLPTQSNKSRTYRSTFGQTTAGVHHRDVVHATGEKVPYLPPNFGLQSKLDTDDSKLLKFYTEAFCTGRTILKSSNFWLVDITAIADGDPCVQHALLASTAAYVLDYIPNEKLRVRANRHYRRATDLLSQALSRPSAQDVGKELGLVSALLLLLCDDVVNWETRLPKDKNPKWHIGSQLAISVLDRSDPGYRYWNPINVQSDCGRVHISNRIAFVDILAQPVSPLKVAANDSRQYGWLLEGGLADVLRIQPGTGLSSKLLHSMSQITQLSARIQEAPDSIIIPRIAQRLAEKLTLLYQTQDSCGQAQYGLENDLFAACVLDKDGKVTTPEEVTQLTAEAWRIAAQIYLECRFFRKPRSHRDVVDKLSMLLRCIELMPSSGTLFTSQSPFFTVFLTGIVGYREEHREVTKSWFDTVLSGAGCRSSVPPIWNVLQSIWKWIDESLEEPEFDESIPVGMRFSWWEKMVDWLYASEGLLSLC